MYATREDVKSAPDFKTTVRTDAQVDGSIEAASRGVEGLLHRRFYPEIATKYFPWPNRDTGSSSWRLWLDDNELASVTSLISGGDTLTGYLLEPQASGPPYTSLELDRSSTSSSFVSGTTSQRSLAITGVWCGCTVDETSTTTLAEALDSSEQTVDVNDSSVIGVGSLIKVDSERLLVTGKQSITSGQTLQANLTNAKNGQAVSVTTGTEFHVGEVITIDTERMFVEDVLGNTLQVTRGYDGATLAAHTAGATIYVPRTLQVTRAALGTTAATHDDDATVSIFNYPSLVRQLVVATSLRILQGRFSGFTSGESTETGNKASKPGDDYGQLCQMTWSAHGRKARTWAV
jgi:hypothetical protein